MSSRTLFRDRWETLHDTRSEKVARSAAANADVADHRNDADTLARWLSNKTPAHFRTWLADSDNHVVVALVDDRLAGVGMLHRSGEIRLFFTAPGMPPCRTESWLEAPTRCRCICSWAAIQSVGGHRPYRQTFVAAPRGDLP